MRKQRPVKGGRAWYTKREECGACMSIVASCCMWAPYYSHLTARASIARHPILRTCPELELLTETRLSASLPHFAMTSVVQITPREFVASPPGPARRSKHWHLSHPEYQVL